MVFVRFMASTQELCCWNGACTQEVRCDEVVLELKAMMLLPVVVFNA
jgi:hypothetical protein